MPSTHLLREANGLASGNGALPDLAIVSIVFSAVIVVLVVVSTVVVFLTCCYWRRKNKATKLANGLAETAAQEAHDELFEENIALKDEVKQEEMIARQRSTVLKALAETAAEQHEDQIEQFEERFEAAELELRAELEAKEAALKAKEAFARERSTVLKVELKATEIELAAVRFDAAAQSLSQAATKTSAAPAASLRATSADVAHEFDVPVEIVRTELDNPDNQMTPGVRDFSKARHAIIRAMINAAAEECAAGGASSSAASGLKWEYSNAPLSRPLDGVTADGTAAWKWESGGHDSGVTGSEEQSFVAYDADIVEALEEAYTKGEADYSFQIRGKGYTIENLQGRGGDGQLWQISQSSGYRRAVVRKLLRAAPLSALDETTTWREFPADVCAQLTAALLKNQDRADISLDPPSSSPVGATVMMRQMVMHRHNDDALFCMRIVDAPSPAITPPHWTPHIEDEAKIFTVTTGSHEYKYVEAVFQLRNPTVKVIKVERVQDIDLWERYRVQKDQRAGENGGDANERWLFHGTQATDPKVIWHDGDVGMDNRFCSSGYYGRGSYFSESAHYSDGYAHNDPSSGHKQMFLVSVVCGESKDYGTSEGRDLTRPPVIPGGNGRIFASVNGHHGNSPDCRMFVTYHNDQAYPRYLVTYDSNPGSTNPGDRSSSAQLVLKQLGCDARLVSEGKAPPPPSIAAWNVGLQSAFRPSGPPSQGCLFLFFPAILS